MARCSYHPDVETELTCTECGKPICPKEMVATPVGYKCPEHARMKRGQYQFVKPAQFMRGLAAGAGVGVLGGVVLGAIGFGGGLFIGLIWGSLAAEAVRRASGGHRGVEVGIAAAIGLGIGWVASLFVGGVSPLTVIVAIVVALVQLAAFGNR